MYVQGDVKYMNLMEEIINWRNEYIEELESLLGPRNPWYSLGRVYFDGRGPQTFLPDGSRAVDIHLGPNAMGNEDLIRWQLAHECLHLLDPLFSRPTIVLEEGLATWYQEEKFKDNNFELGDKYLKAKTLVLNLIESNFLLKKVKELRNEGLRICEITAKDLLRTVPNMTSTRAKALTEKFEPRLAPVSISGTVRL